MAKVGLVDRPARKRELLLSHRVRNIRDWLVFYGTGPVVLTGDCCDEGKRTAESAAKRRS
jgi:hypothetical protein